MYISRRHKEIALAEFIAYRKRRSMTISMAAHMLGVSRQLWSMIERKIKALSMRLYEKICAVLYTLSI